MLGLVPALGSAVPALRHGLESMVQGTGTLAEASRRVLLYGSSTHGVGLALDYTFSALNVALGVLLAVRRPRGLTPRLLSVAFIGTAATFNAPSHELFHVIGSVPVVTGLHFAFHIVSGVAYLWAVLLFPDGRLPFAGEAAGRWPTILAAVASTVVITLVCYLSSFVAHPPFFVAFFGILVPVVGMTAQWLRLRGGAQSPQGRQQSRLLCLALAPALVAAALWLAAHLLARAIPGTGAQDLAGVVERAFPAVFAVVPVVLFVGILRYRLWDIDHLITRALVYTLFAAFIGLVYVAVLAVTAWLAGPRGWSTIIAMAVVAVAAEPVRRRLHAAANRLIFGQRLTPHEAMRVLADRLERVASADELGELTSVVVTGTRCSTAEVWLIADDHLLLAATSPAAASVRTRPLSPGAGVAECRTVTAADVCFPVAHEGELLAVLAVRLPPGVALPPAEVRLIGDLAGHAGLLVANVRLTTDLARQVDLVTGQAADLRRSRLQVVAAHDGERRRLERDIHDGAQQELVALLIQMRVLQRLPVDGGPPADQVAQLRQALATTRATLKQICTGDPPAVLTVAGLAAALDLAVAPARRAGLDVSVACQSADRLPPDVESSLYFCALEAIQNVSKHAHARRVTVRVEQHGGDAVLSVIDDGAGFDPARAGTGSGLSNLTDRMAVLGGTAEIASAPGAGTELSCRVPLTGELTGART
jgi:signal transduction histidine kinase